jgi:hypothetical protein
MSLYDELAARHDSRDYLPPGWRKLSTDEAIKMIVDGGVRSAVSDEQRALIDAPHMGETQFDNACIRLTRKGVLEWSVDEHGGMHMRRTDRDEGGKDE